MNATSILMSLIKWVLTLKFGWAILIGISIVMGFSIIKNIFSGSFNVAKFVGGFNIFSGSIQGKLIYYGFLAILAFGLYHQLTRATFDTDYTNTYKNNIHNNENVTVDQSQTIQTPEDTLLIGIKIFGLKIGVNVQSKPKPVTIIDNKKIDQVAPVPPVVINAPEVKKPKTTILGKVGKVIKFPFNTLKNFILLHH